MNVGILYPRSKAHPEILLDFMDGVKTFLAQDPNNGITIVSEAIGYGGSEKEVYEKAEKLLMLEQVDVLVAYVGEKVMDLLMPLMQASGKLLLVVHPAANYPGSWIPQSNIIQLTLQHAFLCWLCGKEAQKEQDKNAAVASTFYDCGYLHIAVMVNGYTNAGGAVKFNYVNKGAYDDSFNIDELENYLTEATAARNLLCVFDDLPGSLFYEKLNKTSGAAEFELNVSPMMLEPIALAKLGDGFKFKLTGYSPWQAAVATDESSNFSDTYKAKTKRETGIFSLLGWETGMILKEIADNSNLGFEDGAAIAKALHYSKLTGPRGELKLDPTTNYFTASIARCSVEKKSNKMTVTALDFPIDAWQEYIQQPTDGAGSGWTNTYLCY